MMMEGATNLSMMHANHHHQVQTPVAAFHVTIPATTEAGETITVSRYAFCSSTLSGQDTNSIFSVSFL